MFSSLSALKNLQYQNLALFKIAFIQLLCLFLLSTALIFCFKMEVAINFLLGGLVSIVPALMFGQFCFKKKGARAARKILNAIYIGEAFKLMVTALLFAFIFQRKDLLAAWVFLGYIAALMIYFVLLIRFMQLPVGSLPSRG